MEDKMKARCNVHLTLRDEGGRFKARIRFDFFKNTYKHTSVIKINKIEVVEDTFLTKGSRKKTSLERVLHELGRPGRFLTR